MKGDLSQIMGALAGFLVFISSLAIFSYFISYNLKNLNNIIEHTYKYYETRSLELIDFLNNSTNITSSNITIKNIGKVSLDLSCFKLYIDGEEVNFTYHIFDLYKNSLLDPSENATLYFNYSETGWRKVILVSCDGKRFETLIYFYI